MIIRPHRDVYTLDKLGTTASTQDHLRSLSRDAPYSIVNVLLSSISKSQGKTSHSTARAKSCKSRYLRQQMAKKLKQIIEDDVLSIYTPIVDQESKVIHHLFRPRLSQVYRAVWVVNGNLWLSRFRVVRWRLHLDGNKWILGLRKGALASCQSRANDRV